MTKKKLNLYFVLEFHSYRSVRCASELTQAKYVKLALNSKLKYKLLAAAAFVFQDMQNLDLSRRCFAEDGKGMFKDL